MVALAEMLDAFPNLVGILLKLLVSNLFRRVGRLAPPVCRGCVVNDLDINVVFNLDVHFMLF